MTSGFPGTARVGLQERFGLGSQERTKTGFRGTLRVGLEERSGRDDRLPQAALWYVEPANTSLRSDEDSNTKQLRRESVPGVVSTYLSVIPRSERRSKETVESRKMILLTTTIHRSPRSHATN